MATVQPTTPTLIEDAVIKILLQTGPRTLDDVAEALPVHNWNELFSAVDEMSRDGRVVLRRLAGSGYQLSVPVAPLRIAAGRQQRTHVRFCVGCGYLCDEIQPDNVQGHWVEARHYLKKYGLTWNELDRTDDMCPPCSRVLACGRRRIYSRVGSMTAVR
ncbi:MAG: hypothetical protein AB7F94_19685 [Nitrospira sp.]